MLTARGDVEILDAVEENESWDDHDVPALPDDIAFTTGDWLNLLKPMGTPAGAPPNRLRRLSAMVAAIAGIALAVVTFSFGRPMSNVTLQTSAAPIESTGVDDDGRNGDDSVLALAAAGVVAPGLLSSDEADFLGLDPQPQEGITSTTTEPTTTTIGWSEPVIPPESEWVDAGNGVAVPDVLLRIRFCESTNNYRASHTVSSARGAYQFLTKSWEWYGHAARYGVASADLATPAQQDEAAVLTVKRDGTRPWLASWRCWGSNSIASNYATVRPPAQPTTTSTTEVTSTSSSDGTDTTVESTTSTSSTDTTETTPTTAENSTTSTTESTTTTETTTPTTENTSTSADAAGAGATEPTGG